MDNFNQYFAQKLRELRRNSGFTQAQLAAVLNTERSTIAKYETAVSRPNLETIERLAKILGVSVMTLLPPYPERYVASENSRHGVEDSQQVYQLRRDERALLAKYRTLSDDGKKQLEQSLNALLKEELQRSKNTD